MRRRLTLTLVAVALAAVTLVGIGVLFLAQLGARAETERSVEQQLEALSELVERPGSLRELRSLDATRDAFGLRDLELVVIDGRGQVRRLVITTRPAEPGRQNGRLEPTLAPEVLFVLDDAQLQQLTDGENLLLDRDLGPRSAVAGLRRLDVDTRLLGPDAALAVLASQEVVAIGRRAQVWFVVSAALVVAGSLAVAAGLARRLTRPIAEIERATASIAAGDFSVRVSEDGQDELGQLGQSVNRMAQHLERSKALDQQFLMSISHDLRTPLTAITGYAEALSDGAAPDPGGTGRIIASHAGRLERLVGDLLDLAKLDANRFTLRVQPADLTVIAGRATAGLTHLAEGHGLDLRFVDNGPVPVEVDVDRMAQVVGNVIDNAVKFARSHVVVETGVDGDDAIVTVTDDGPGISPEDLPHVFERLYVSRWQPERAENPSGMGLAIVRELMTAMGGTVVAHSEPGAGTTFLHRLPLATARTA